MSEHELGVTPESCLKVGVGLTSEGFGQSRLSSHRQPQGQERKADPPGQVGADRWVPVRQRWVTTSWSTCQGRACGQGVTSLLPEDLIQRVQRSMAQRPLWVPGCHCRGVDQRILGQAERLRVSCPSFTPCAALGRGQEGPSPFPRPRSSRLAQ